MSTGSAPRISLSLWARLFLLVASLVAVSTVVISVKLLNRVRFTMAEAFRERGELIASGFSQKAAEGVLIEDQRVLGRSIEQLCADKDVAYVTVYGESGLRLAHKTARPDIEAPPPVGNERSTMPSSEMRSVALGNGATVRVLDIVMPVKYEGEQVGCVDLGVSLERIDAEIGDRILSASLFLALFLSCGLVVSFVFSRSLTKPLEHLLRGVQRIGEGDLSHRISIRRQDEIGRLAGAVNEMATGLMSKTTSIENLNKEILARKETERQLDVALRRAEEGSLAKSQFLANMSHEIRTPMNAVLGFADLLTCTELDETQREYVTTIQESGRILLSLISDILDISKIEAGKISLEAIPFDLQGVLEGVNKIVSSKIVGKELDLVLDYDRAAPRGFKGDPTRLRQIMMNLLGNAIKFTEKGEIVVTVRDGREASEAAAGAPGMRTVRISVRDTGIGIPRDKIGQLFKAFTQVDASVTRRYGGTGLGLTITKALVEKMQGKIWIESEEGKGSTFIFTVLLQEMPACREIDIEPADIAVLSGRTVVIADDSPGVCDALRARCEAVGMDVVHVCHASDALFAWCDLHHESVPDVCIVDTMLPGLRSEAGTLGLRDHAGLSRAALVGLTPTPLETAAPPPQDSGFAALVAKPVGVRELYRALTQVAKGTTREKKLTPSAPAQEASFTGKNVLVVEDNEMNLKLVKSVLRPTGCVIDSAADGREAVEKVRHGRYDIILMDVQMPGMDGLEATRIIRRELKSETPIIALTAAAMKEDEQRVRESGMDDYLAKPLDIEQLKLKMRRWVSVGPGERQRQAGQ